MKNKFSSLRFFNPFLKLWLCFLIQIKMMDDGNLYDQSLNSNCLFLMLLCYLCTHKVFFCFTKKEQREMSYPAAWIRKQFWGKKGLNIFFCCAAERRIFHPDYRKNLWDSWKYLQNRAKCCFKYRQVTFIFQRKGCSDVWLYWWHRRGANCGVLWTTEATVSREICVFGSYHEFLLVRLLNHY